MRRTRTGTGAAVLQSLAFGLLLALCWPALALAQSGPPEPVEAGSAAPEAKALPPGPARLEIGRSGIAAEPGRAGNNPALALRLALDRPAPYRLLLLDDPRRLVIDFFRTALPEGGPEGLAGAELVRAVRWGKAGADTARVVVELPYAVALDDVAQSDGALRLRLVPVPEAAFAAEPDPLSALWRLPSPSLGAPAKEGPAGAAPRLRVAVDPGHGGADAGAVEGGLREAALMLDMARVLTEKLIRAGFEVVMTRHEDAFVGLEERMTRARAAGAGLFISLHADALPEGQATGAQIFIWNREADDRAARQLAARHDRADLLAGLDLGGTDDQLASVLMDMARLETQPKSENAAKFIASHLAQAGLMLRRHPVKGAAFSVLKSPDIPSVLIELGFLTDPQDRANLIDPEWQQRMAGAIAEAVAGWAAAEADRRLLLRR